MITLQEWRAVCPDITDAEWPLVIDVLGGELETPAAMRIALAAFRRGHAEGWVAGFDTYAADVERGHREGPGRRGWRDCACRSRMLLIACRDCGVDRTVELLSRWGYRLAEQRPRSDGRAAAEALDRALGRGADRG